MVKDWQDVVDTANSRLMELRKAIPEVAKGFGGLAKAATSSGELDGKTKELIALGISVSIRCDTCVAFHVRAAIKQGATRQEMADAIGMAVYMGGGPSLMYGADALAAVDQFMDAG